MTRWLSLPAVRFAMRQSLRLAHVTPAMLVLVGVFAAGDAPDRQWAIVSVFALVYAIPFAATRLIEADRDGRHNHLRLTGHAEGRLLASLALGWAGPWLLVGALAIGAWIAAGNIDGTGWLFVAALVGASLTLSLLALSLPRGEVGPDARLMAIGLVGIALLGSMAQLLAIQGLSTSGRRLTTIVHAIAIGLLVAEIVASALILPSVLRTMARPALAARGRSPLLRLLNPGWNPAMSRAFNLCALPATYMAAIATLLLAVLWLAFPSEPAEADWLFIYFVVYAPLALCLFIISTGTRGDRESGRFDLLRVTSTSPVITLVSIAAGACLPFLIATAGLHAFVWGFWGQLPSGFLATLVAMAFAAPVAGVEGWLRRWPMVYTAPLVVVVLQGILADDLSVWQLALLLWIPWAGAIRVFRRPERPPLEGWPGVATAVSVAVVAIGPVLTPLHVIDTRALCIVLFLLAGMIVGRHASTALDRWAPGVASALVAAAIVLKSGQPVLSATVVALAPFSAWWLVMRVHLSTTDAWSIGIRALLVAAAILTVPYEFRLYGYFAPFVSLRDPARAQWVWRSYVLSTAMLLIPALLGEIAYRIRRRRAPADDRATRS